MSTVLTLLLKSFNCHLLLWLKYLNPLHNLVGPQNVWARTVTPVLTRVMNQVMDMYHQLLLVTTWTSHQVVMRLLTNIANAGATWTIAMFCPDVHANDQQVEHHRDFTGWVELFFFVLRQWNSCSLKVWVNMKSVRRWYYQTDMPMSWTHTSHQWLFVVRCVW